MPTRGMLKAKPRTTNSEPTTGMSLLRHRTSSSQRRYANSLKSTGTTLDTPASIMVTPYIISVLAMVRLLCVTMINWLSELVKLRLLHYLNKAHFQFSTS